MTYDDFELDLRRGLATLAREAVPDDRAVGIDDLPKVQALRSPERRVGTRAVAAAIVVVLAAGLVALMLGRRDHSPRVETPKPTWTQVGPFPLLARYEQSAVFTGREVIVWGGRAAAVNGVATPATPKIPPDALGDGAAYDVGSNSWGVLPSAPIESRYDAVAAWTGKEMILTGGMRDGTGPSGGIEFLRDGAAYDPAHRRWRRIPDAPGCPAFGTWTGTELVVGGNCANTTREPFMAAYDPARNAWKRLPSHAVATQLVAAGGRVFAWTGDSGPGAVLDPTARRWATLPPLPDAQRADSFATADNGHLAVVGLLQRSSEARDIATVDIFDVNRRTWRHFESEAVTPALLGSEITNRPNELMWSGGLGYSRFLGPSASARPVWSSAGDSPVELGATGESLVPIGPGRFFVWGGMLASHGDGRPNRPTAQGAILQFP
jgi:N-acetylneuraminic acid mutarotase